MAGRGVTKIISASSKQSMTAICRFDAAFLILKGMYDHFLRLGDLQNVAEDESELSEEEAEASPLEGSLKLAILLRDGVAGSFGDLSMKGSLIELNGKKRANVFVTKPMIIHNVAHPMTSF